MTKSSRFGWIAGSGLFFIALVLRPPVASLGPLLNDIVNELSLTPLMSGVLAAAPVLCFGIGAFASPKIVSRFGVDRAMAAILAVILISMSLRLTLGYAGLLTGTLAAGLAIAVANVLLPSIVRKRYPNHVALVTGMYTTVLAVSASLAATIAVPSSQILGGWRPALAIWIVPAILAFALWIPVARVEQPDSVPIDLPTQNVATSLHRSMLAWSIVGFFGIQSLGFYAILAWLPSILVTSGASAAEAGANLGLATAVGIPFGFIVSSLIKRFSSLAWWASGASLVTLGGFAALWWVVQEAEAVAGQKISTSTLIIACVLIGLGQATTFPLSLTLISTRANSQIQTTKLSAMAQGWGYLLAAAGTFLIGFLSQAFQSWGISLQFLIAVTLLQVIIGFYAGKPGQIKN